jgi:2-polyprenyl-3-methyl-5-hydroxy-6-metoxy-1,4-benzoquinol methylase
MKCLACNHNEFLIIWDNPIRKSAVSFTKKKEKVFQCENCQLTFLEKKRKLLEDSATARKIYNRNNSIKEFFRFHSKRETKKFLKILKYVSLNNKNVLELNCGAGVILSILRKKSKSTCGIDSLIYKDFLVSNGHQYYQNVQELKNNKKKYDIIFSLSELEHKYDPLQYLHILKKILSKKGRLIIRVPNFFNIYSILLEKYFYKYDYRTSHNFYFSKKNLDLIFKKANFKIEKVFGYHEYDLNHLLYYFKTKKRVEKKYPILFDKKDNDFFVANVEKSFFSTSLIYILK